MNICIAIVTALLSADCASTARNDSLTLEPVIQQKCLEVLRSGLHSDQFWPSIHAAEGLTLGGYGDEVIAYLEPKLPLEKDDQQKCGFARELVRAGQRKHATIMLKILAGDDDYGHIHAAESLYKVNIIGDGKAMRRAFEQTNNLRLRLMSAAALARQGDKSAFEFLRNIVSQGCRDQSYGRLDFRTHRRRERHTSNQKTDSDGSRRSDESILPAFARFIGRCRRSRRFGEKP